MGEVTTEEKKSPEMTPQEDGTKVLLNEDGPTVRIEEAKYVADPNGDAKINIGSAPVFSGLTKEELMKYSNDPFWVRLRWFLFILFWLGWLAMLIMAVVIIVQAPGCKPPPELLWVEENPMVELDLSNLPLPDTLINKCDALGISSVYMSKYISSSNFEDTNYDVTIIIKALTEAKKEAVTDLPASIDAANPLFGNASDESLIHRDGTWNYNNDALAAFVFKEIVKVWVDQGVKGFITEDPDTPEKRKFLEELNKLAKPVGGAVGSNMVPEIDLQFDSPSSFQEFLEDSSTKNWTFYEFNPKSLAGPTMDEETTKMLIMGLFMVPGTPILQDFGAIDNSTTKLIKYLSAMKSLTGIQFGATEFVNNTSPDVIAFTRVYKGTPAHAVALNLNNNNETVTFEETQNVGETGTIKVLSTPSEDLYAVKGKKHLNDVNLGPYEGVILEFVASF